nr:hypothetical protein [Tanacetum cinerariifolium]
MLRKLDNVSGKVLMYPRFIQTFLDKQLDGLPTHKEKYDVSFHTKKVFANIKKIGTGFSGKETPLFPTMKVLDIEDELKRTKIAQQTKIDGLERRVKKLKKKQRSRTHKLKILYKVGLTVMVISSSDDEALDKEDTSNQGRIDEIDADEDIALISIHDDVSTQDNIAQDKGIEDVGEEEVVEVVTAAKMIIDDVVDAAQVTTAIADIPVSNAETIVTTALTITAKSTKTNVKVQDKEKKKFFAAKRDEEKRNKPPIKAQQRNIMSTYLKNMDGWKIRSLKKKSFAKIQELFDKAMKRINTFVDFRTELVEKSTNKDEAETTQESISKREGDELEQARSKKQKRNLEVLWRLVKARFEKVQPVDNMDSFLLHTLKTMFEHHAEDNVWMNQQELVKVKNWKLYDSCGVHCVTIQMILYYMLVKKMYLLTNHTLHQMFNDVKLQVDYECEMAYELLRLFKKQLKEGYRAN